MARYVLSRFLLFLPTLLGVVTLVFFLNRAAPGDPVEIMLGENASVEKREELSHALGLDRPLLEQFGHYLGGLAKGRLGTSLRSGRPVAEELARSFPFTAELGTAALLLACLLAFPLGLAAAGSPGSRVDRGIGLLSSAGLSVPSFFLGPVLLLAFAVELPWFPVSGADEPGSLFLPALTLAVPMAALLTRIIEASIGEESGKEYVRTARMKGLSRRGALGRHALRNALLPVVTVVGLQFGAILTGAILTEKIFRWPGLGTLVLTAIGGRDYPVVQGAVLLFALVTLGVNLVTDLCYAALDPRVRYDG